MSAVAPLTDRLSSTVTVPPVESIVRLPEVVSISLPSTLTLSTVALPLTSRTPLTVVLAKVETPATIELPDALILLTNKLFHLALEAPKS